MIATTVMAMALLSGSPRGELHAALNDLHTRVPAELRATTRYASLYHLPAEQHEETLAALSLVLNSVSRAATIERARIVPGTTLVRWNLLQIAPDRDDLAEIHAAYEAMVSGEPYWHLRTKVVDPRDGQAREVFTDGGWVDLHQAPALRSASGSAAAVLRADWLLAALATPPHYYRFAGVPQREAELFASLGIDPEEIGKLRADEGANLVYSGVTGKVRRVVRRQGPLGGAWQTYDVSASAPERDPLRNPFSFVYDATEHIAAKANGLHVFALYDAQGRRQDAVPDVIAKDDSDLHGDGIIVPLLSCVRCHVEDGVRPFRDDQSRIPLLGTENPALTDRLRQFYGSPRGELRFRRDQEDYANAVREATGMEVPQAAAALAAVYRRARYELVTPETARRELGLKEELRVVLSASSDPVLLLLCEGRSVQRQQWESSFAEAAMLAEGHRLGD